MADSLLTRRPVTAETGDDAELARVLETYLAAVEAGAAPSAAELVAAHPHLAERLEACLASLAFVEQAGGEMGAAALVDGVADPLADERATLGDFRLVREIGRGGMGIVYEAEQLSLARRVAVKVLPFAAMLDQRQLARFKNEARAAAGLNHPHIVPVYYVGVERGVHFYAMQYIEGKSLAELSARSSEQGAGNEISSLLAPSSPLQAETTPLAHAATLPDATSPAHFRRIAELGVQAAEALHYAHESGVIHRDVKPSNLLVEAGDCPLWGRPRSKRGLSPSPELDDFAPHLWVADFGLARIGADATLTVTGDLVGTLRYMSPEQLRGKAAMVDQRTDVYSLGVTLYELLTGRPAFSGDNSELLLRQILETEPPGLRAVKRGIPADLETIVLKAIRKDAADRYASAQEMADDLRRFVCHKPILAKPVTRLQKGAKWLQRHSNVLWSTVAILVLTTIVSLVSATLISRERQVTVAQLAETELNRRRVDENFRDALHTLEWLAARAHATSLGDSAELRSMQSATASRVRTFLTPFLDSHSTDSQARLQKGIAYIHLGRLCVAINETSEAQAAYLQAIRTFRSLAHDHSTDPIPLFELAVAETILGVHLYANFDAAGAERHLDFADAAYRKCLSLAPRHAGALSMSVCLCTMRNRGILQCQEQLALYIAEQGMDEFAWYLTGAVAYRTGRWRDAVDALGVTLRKAAEERQQLRSQTQLFLAMAYWRLGREDEARLVLSKAVANDLEIRQLFEDSSLLHAEATALIKARPPKAHSGTGIAYDNGFAN